jgi:hypothetical protein
MTLSAVGSVFSSSEDQQHSHPSQSSRLTTPKRHSKQEDRVQQQQLSPVSPVLSPAAASSGGGGGLAEDSSLLTDLSFTPPHPYTQLNILSSGRKPADHSPASQEQLLGELSSRNQRVSEKLHHLATSLEQWTSIVAASPGAAESLAVGGGEEDPVIIQRIKEHLIPDIVSRLRYLSGTLDGTIDLNDYEETFGGDSVGSSSVSDIVSRDLNASFPAGNDGSVLSASSTLTPSRPMNGSRLISRAYDSDDSVFPSPPPVSSSKFSPNPKPGPAVLLNRHTAEPTLSDWVGAGRGDPSDLSLDDGADDISPIQILYAKPSHLAAKTSSQPSPSTFPTTRPKQSSSAPVPHPL